MGKVKLVSVLLNYNSNIDLFQAIEDLKKQSITNHTIVVVDNCSSSDSLSDLKYFKDKEYSYALSGNVDFVFDNLSIFNEHEIVFIYNSKNSGYSAGNNVGIKVADKLDADYVFIVNPDMRIFDKDYLHNLVNHGQNDNNATIVASRIIGVDGENQSPMVADDFWREFLWPKQLFPKLFKQPKFIEEIDSENPVYVSKVMGCALLLKMDFLKKIGFLDETTFLYSEEAILSSQAKSLGKKIKFIPTLTAYHMHKKENKDNASKRMISFLRSRIYYLNNYSEYSKLQVALLRVSYFVLKIMHIVKYKIL